MLPSSAIWQGGTMRRLALNGLVAIGLMFVAVLAGTFTGARAVAQAVKAALVKSVDERGRTAWQVTQQSNCTNYSSCFISFPQVPLGKRLVIEYVSGVFENF